MSATDDNTVLYVRNLTDHQLHGLEWLKKHYEVNTNSGAVRAILMQAGGIIHERDQYMILYNELVNMVDNYLDNMMEIDEMKRSALSMRVELFAIMNKRGIKSLTKNQ